MPDEQQPPKDLRDAPRATDELTAALLAQLDDLQRHLLEASAYDLAAVLSDLQARVSELLAMDDGSLSAASEGSLRTIAAATDRIEQVRERMIRDLAEPSGAEGALRRWTRSQPGDERHRPESTHGA